MKKSRNEFIKNLHYLCLGAVLVLMTIGTGCGGGGGGGGGGAPPSDGGDGAPSVDKWTYMVYMGADNNLSLAGLYDLNEMETVGSTDDVNIVLQAEFSDYYTPGVPTSTLRFLVQNDNDDTDANLSAGTSIGNVDMGDPATLTAFIQWATQNYPAEHYALIIWDHGAGWKERSSEVRSSLFRGAVQDETSGSFMSLPDLAKAVSDGGVNMDIINFDACLMAMYEVAYEFNGLVDYMAFSEETEPGEGDPYDTILGALTANPSMSAQTLASTIIDEYDAFYADNPRGATTKSAIDMSQIDELNEKLLELANALMDEPIATLIVGAAQENTQDYAYAANHDVYDFCSYLVSSLLPDGPAKTAAAEIMTLIDTMVIANKTNPDSDIDTNHGLAIYLPSTSETNDEDLGEYELLACNQSRASATGTWGAYVEALIDDLGGGTVVYGGGGFGLKIYWTDANDNPCDADLDLFVWEPDADFAVSGQGQWYAAYTGQTTPNGFFSQDSYDSGISEEYYIANDQVYWGDYYFGANYWQDGSSCSNAKAHLLVYDPSYEVWLELNETNFPGFTLNYPSPQELNLTSPYQGGCSTLFCMNSFSDWWVPEVFWLARIPGSSMFFEGGDLPISDKKNQIIFRLRR